MKGGLFGKSFGLAKKQTKSTCMRNQLSKQTNQICPKIIKSHRACTCICMQTSQSYWTHKIETKSDCNIPPEEIQALNKLIKLQRDRVIKIIVCDKGARIIILDFKRVFKVLL